MKRARVWQWLSLVVLGVAWLLLAAVSLSGTFGDERENVVAGWLVTKGLVPYRDFFFHHAPLPYFLAAVPAWFGQQWWLFRLLVVVLNVAVGSWCWWLVSARMKWVVALSWLAVAVAAPTFLFQMYLAESLVLPVVLALTLGVIDQWWLPSAKLRWWWLSWAIGSWWVVFTNITGLLPITWLAVGLTVVSARAWLPAGKTRWLRWQHLLELIRYSWQQHRLRWLVFGGGLLSGPVMLVCYFAWHQAMTDWWWGMVGYNWEFYFPLRLAGSSAAAQQGFLVGLGWSWWHYLSTTCVRIVAATITLAQTTVGSVRVAATRPNELVALLRVAGTSWWQQLATWESASFLAVVGMSGLVVGKRRGGLWLWLLVLILLARNRENELFKLGVFYGLLICIWLATAASWWPRRWVVGLMWFVGLSSWLGLAGPQYLQHLGQPRPLFPPAEVATAERLNQALGAYQGPIYHLGGNPDYYLLTGRLPAYRYFYYHSWFHDAPPIRQAVQGFLAVQQTAPVIIESEVNPAVRLEYAQPVLDQIHLLYQPTSPGVYWKQH